MTASDADMFCDIVATPGVCGIDTETTISNAVDREVCTLQVSHSDGRSAVVYCYRQPELIARLMRAITDSPCVFSAHFAVFEAEVFHKYGARPQHLECTYIASRVLRGVVPGNDIDPGFSLDDCAYRELGIKANKETRSRDWTQPLDTEAIIYCLQDADLARDLWLVLSFELEGDPDQMSGYRIVADALPAIAACNMNGVDFDVDGHQQLCVQLQDDANDRLFEMDLICEGAIANHNSSQQIGVWVAQQITFEEGCTPVRASMLMATMIGVSWKLTASGHMSFDKNYIGSILHEIEPYWPNVAEYLRARAMYQKAAKMLQSFGPSLRAYVSADGSIRGSLIPHGARTSRQSCRTPNLQNQPAEDAFRAMYKARKGRKIVQADYEQIELVVGCVICNDEAMKEVFRQRQDIHSATAAKIGHIPMAKFDHQTNPLHNKLRKNGKPVTFAALYGAGVSTIALNAMLPVAEAAQLLEDWLTIYPGVRAYRQTQPDLARAAGYVELVSGQRIALTSDSRAAQLINAPVQGSAASVMYLALTRVHAALEDYGLDAKLALNVHDEILIDASPEDAIAAGRVLEYEMTEALYQLFPETRTIKVGRAAEACVIDRWDQKDDRRFKIDSLMKVAA